MVSNEHAVGAAVMLRTVSYSHTVGPKLTGRPMLSMGPENKGRRHISLFCANKKRISVIFY